MDTQTGRIIDAQRANELNAKFGYARCVEMKVAPTEQQMKRKPPKVGRNEPCPCGSGLKFKKCCLGKNKRG